MKEKDNTFASWGTFVTSKRETLKDSTNIINTNELIFENPKLLMAIKIWVNYHYNCEMYEREILNHEIYDKYGFILTMGNTLCNKFAYNEMKELEYSMSYHNIGTENYFKAKDIVSRYTFKELEAQQKRFSWQNGDN